MTDYFSSLLELRDRVVSYLLFPVSLVYSVAFIAKYFMSKPRKVNAKVICVGNVIVGGAGKTPLVQHLVKKNKDCAIILRGYGGRLSGRNVVKVDPKKHTHLQVGDEALLHAKIAPTYICKNRYKAAKAACKDGAKTIIMDDGFQNFTLKKDHSILVFDTEYGIGNGMMLPSGRLREPLSFARRRADELILLSYDGNFKKPFEAEFTEYNVEVINKQDVYGKSFIAMCGIANPNKFFKSLTESNIKILKKIIFVDHHSYSVKEIEDVVKLAKDLDVKVITTSKDILKVPYKYRKSFVVLHIGLKKRQLMS